MIARTILTFGVVSLLCAAPLAAATAADYAVLPVPDDLRESAWLEGRQLEQVLEAVDYSVFIGFGFSDRLLDSKIGFTHQVVDDAGKYYKAVHYDHGNGVASADVDGDGHLDLYFTNQVGANELWRNLGNGQFEDITAAAGVGVSDRISVGASFADIDNDGDEDLYVTTVRQGNLLFRNDGSGKFTDISKAARVDYTGHSSGAVFFDYNNDGLLDLYVSNVGVYTTDEKGHAGYWVGYPDAFAGHLHPERYERSRLYRNLGKNRFRDVTKATRIGDDAWTGDAHPADLDDDGFMDLYVLNMQGHDEYYRNDAGKRFQRVSRTLFPYTSWGSMGVAVFDFENDGLPDIFVTDMHTDMVEELDPLSEKNKMPRTYPEKYLATDGKHVLGNAFFSNRGKGVFAEVSDDIGAENFWPWGLSIGDLNADGYQDAFITSSMNYPYRYGINSLLLNQNGERFVDAEFVLGVEPRQSGTAAPWFRIDCAGDDSGHELCENRDGRFEVWGALGSRSSVILDVDGDGDLDIVTNDFNSPPMVLISDLSEKADLHYVQVALEGVRSNRDGLGAHVVVVAGQQRFHQVHSGKSGYLAQSAMPLYFGLGPHDKIDRIEIRWPAGTVQVVSGPLATNRLHKIVEPGND